jgi:hypothetical protein
MLIFLSIQLIVKTMVELEEVEVQKGVQEPRMSLKQFAKFCTVSPRAQETILRKAKFPGGYIPKFHEMARKIICGIFSSNLGDFELYFEEFLKHAARLRSESLAYDVKTDEHRNRKYSASALESLVKISKLIIPILKAYTFDNNLRMRRDATEISGVKLGAVSDLLCNTDSGLTFAGFIKFNFTAAELKKEEAAHMLYVLKKFSEATHGIEIDPRHCILIDVVSGKIYQGLDTGYLTLPIHAKCMHIKDRWDHIEPPVKKQKDS